MWCGLILYERYKVQNPDNLESVRICKQCPNYKLGGGGGTSLLGAPMFHVTVLNVAFGCGVKESVWGVCLIYIAHTHTHTLLLPHLRLTNS